MARLPPIKISYNGISLEANISPELPLNRLFEECRFRLGVFEPSTNFLFWHFRPIQITNIPVGSLKINLEKPILLLISKTNYDILETYLNTKLPSLVVEASKAPIKGIPLLEKIMSFHVASNFLEDQDINLTVKSILPKNRFEINDLDLKLNEIVKWFHDEYYTYLTFPNCHVCGHITFLISQVPITRSEFEGLPYTTELYLCKDCGANTRFPRFNKPSTLLKTRIGRAHEFCVSLSSILKYFNYHVRFVTDFSDHEWLEVWSENFQRFVHVDPCEGIVDSPLLYEYGWSKDFQYVISISQYECIDVTRRYTRKFNSIIQNRNQLIDEEWFQKIISFRNNQWNSLLKEKDQEILFKKLLLDYKSMINDFHEPSEKELKIRISGL